MRTKDIPGDLRPRERAFKYGISSLNDYELLALIIGSGSKGQNVLDLARDLLCSYQDFPTMSISNLESFLGHKGISKAKACSLSSVFEIAKRLASSSRDLEEYSPLRFAKKYRLTIGDSPTEKLLLICLDKKKSVRREKIVFSGGEESLATSMKLILSEANDPLFSSFVIMHNHPSGNVLPSKGELIFTHELKEKAKTLGLELTDHLIISNKSYYSFRDNKFI